MAKDISINVKINGIGNAKDQLQDTINDIENNPIEIPVEVKTEGSIQELKRLKAELKKADVGSEAFKDLFGQIDDLEDKIKGAKQVSSDWIDSLEQSGGVLGQVGKGLNSLKVQFGTLGGAIKATGIGLLVTLLGGLVGAFKDNETAMKKIQPLLDGVAKIFQGLFRVVEPLFNILVDLALKALPIVTDAIGNVYSVVSAVVESFGALGRAIGKLVTGDFSGAWKEAKSSVSDFSRNFTDSKNRYIAGTQEMTAHEKEEAEKRAEARRKEIEAREKAEADAKKKREKLAEEEKKRQEAEKKRLEDLENDRIAFQAIINKAEVEDWKRTRDEKEKADEDFFKEIDAIEEKIFDTKVKNAEATKKIDEAKQKQNELILDSSVDGLNTLTDVLGEQTDAGKASAIASTTISTYSSAVKAFDSLAGIPIVGTALGAVAAGIAVASGLANVKRIISVKTPKGGGGGGSTPSVPSISSTPLTPQTNLVGNSTNFNTATATPINGQQNTFTVKAYVSETDITNSQNFISKVKSSAEI